MKSKIRNILLVVMLFVSLVVLNGCKERYQVEKEVISSNSGMVMSKLVVKINGRPRDLAVALFSPNGGFVERPVRKLSMEMTGCATVSLPFGEFSLKDSSPKSYTEKNYTKAGYKLVIWKTKNGIKGAKVHDETVSFISREGNLSIARAGEVGKAGL